MGRVVSAKKKNNVMSASLKSAPDLVSGTPWEGKFNVNDAVRKAVEKNPTIVQPNPAKNNEDARVEWLTYGSINEWTNHLKEPHS